MSRRRSIGVAMLGYAFMGKAHSRALLATRALAPDAQLYPALVSISGRNLARVTEAGCQFGWAEVARDWTEQVVDERIELFDNTGPNSAHVEPTLAALEHGKHVLCEKPLAISADDAYRMWAAAEESDLVHMTGFNLRFAPAVRLAKRLLEAGELGEVIHFRARFLECNGLTPNQRYTWRDDKTLAGSGALGDLGSHIIDLARYLGGEVDRVSAQMKVIRPERIDGRSEVDDAFTASVEFVGGAIGTLEASRVAGGWASRCAFELDGSLGSLAFSSERINELQFAQGRTVRTIRVTDPSDPFMEHWWPSPGHPIGWADSFTNEFWHLFGAIDGQHTVAPIGADFRDGYLCAEICEAIERSSELGTWERPERRDLGQSEVDLGATAR